jgi:hypothetical protein
MEALEIAGEIVHTIDRLAVDQESDREAANGIQ